MKSAPSLGLSRCPEVVPGQPEEVVPVTPPLGGGTTTGIPRAKAPGMTTSPIQGQLDTNLQGGFDSELEDEEQGNVQAIESPQPFTSTSGSGDETMTTDRGVVQPDPSPELLAQLLAQEAEESSTLFRFARRLTRGALRQAGNNNGSNQASG